MLFRSHRRFIKLLSASQFLNCASFFKLSFEFLQRFFNVFGVDLYEAGLGEYVESIFAELIAGKGAVRETLKKHLAEE